MSRSLLVHFLPDLVSPEALAGRTVVVIDVLRATTTIMHALAAGASRVIPCLEVADAQRIAAELPHGQAITGGERKGLRIEGFDLGNSPREFTAAIVAGKTVVFTTTNGTRALDRAKLAQQALIGGFVNLSAVVDKLAHENAVDLLCAGTRQQITREDVLLAGAIVDRLESTGGLAWELNDEAAIARAAWRQAHVSLESRPFNSASIARLTDELHGSQGGRNLTRIGLAGDISDAAAVDRFDLVPHWDPAQCAIVLP